MDDKKSKRIVWTPKIVKIDSIDIFESNPRIITESGLKQLEESFDEVGMFQPLAINTDNKLLSGHARLMQLKKDGYLEVTVMVPDRKLTPKQEKALVIRANKNVAGQWDFDVLANEFEFEDLIDWGFNADELGVPEIEKIDPQCDEDEVPEVKDTVTKRGDIWLLGNHRVMCGDSTMIDDVEKLMKGEKADMVFTDPPYNTGMSKKNNHGSAKLSHMFDDDYEEDEWLEFIGNFSKNYWLATKDSCAHYVCLNWKRSHELVSIYLKNGFKFSNLIIWDKVVHGLGSDYKYTHEYIHVFKKGKPEINSHQGEDAEYSDVWHIQRKMGKDEEHATKKPIELVERPIRHASKNNDMILDLFLGSGSTLIACEKTNRKCYGMELDEHYVDIIISRWQKYTGKKATLEATGQTYDELLEVRNA